MIFTKFFENKYLGNNLVQNRSKQIRDRDFVRKVPEQNQLEPLQRSSSLLMALATSC